MNRLKKQIDFIIEIDKLKKIIRKTPLFDNSRKENDAEHSWHISLMAIILLEYSNHKVDILRVIKMLLIHDLVEIDAGDTFLYAPNRNDRFSIEKKAAEKIFSILPDDQKEEFLNLWVEFEQRNTDDSKFAAVLDRLEPLLQNYLTKGATWKEFDIEYNQVVNANEHICDGSLELWEYVKLILNESVDKNYLRKD